MHQVLRLKTHPSPHLEGNREGSRDGSRDQSQEPKPMGSKSHGKGTKQQADRQFHSHEEQESSRELCSNICGTRELMESIKVEAQK